MVIKIKLFWKIFMVLFSSFTLWAVFRDFQQLGFFKSFFYFIGGLWLFFISVFILPSVKVTFEKKGIRIYWKISLGFKILYEKLSAYIPYDAVHNVSSFFPTWFPFQMITVSGNGQSLILGMFYIKKKETFALLAKKLKPHIMDRDAQKILFKYKKKYQNRLNKL